MAGGRIFALDSNNGIIALKYGLRLDFDPTPGGMILTWNWAGTLQSATTVAGPYSDVLSSATSPHTNTAAAPQSFRLRR